MLSPSEWNNPGAVHAWNAKVEADRKEREREEQRKRRVEICASIKQGAFRLFKHFFWIIVIMGLALGVTVALMTILERLPKLPSAESRGYEQIIEGNGLGAGKGYLLTVYTGCQGKKIINYKTLDVVKYEGVNCHASR